ncbi:MAG: hemolysin family protein [Lachnospiraceae bacterium]|nr:hemolysin family protein [Lachnospiraceae bacterium]
MDDGCSPLWGCIIFVVFIVLNGIFYGYSVALENASENEIEKQGNVKSTRILDLMDDSGRFCATAQAVAVLLGILTGYIGLKTFIQYGAALLRLIPFCSGLSTDAVWIISGILIFLLSMSILLAFGYLAPRKISLHHPEKTLFRYYGFVSTVVTVFTPFTVFANVLGNLLVRIFGIDPNKYADEVTEEEIISIVDEAHEQGVIEENEAEMIQNIIEFGDTNAKDIMTHRKNIIALDGEMSLDDAMAIMLEENNSRYPVYKDDIDNIIGIIHLKDAMKQLTYHKMGHIAIEDIPNLIREAEIIPETRSIDTIFQFMQTKKVHMVIVVDEYGQTTGLVAMEDILEEIVGNILDEYDDDEVFIQHQFDDSILMDGLTPLEQVGEVLQVDFDDEEFETLNGYLTALLDHIPNEDDKEVSGRGFLFQILSVDKHIIQKVRVDKLPEEEEGEETCQDIQNSPT